MARAAEPSIERGCWGSLIAVAVIESCAVGPVGTVEWLGFEVEVIGGLVVGAVAAASALDPRGLGELRGATCAATMIPPGRRFADAEWFIVESRSRCQLLASTDFEKREFLK
jgi:hypothetical protein